MHTIGLPLWEILLSSFRDEISYKTQETNFRRLHLEDLLLLYWTIGLGKYHNDAYT